MIKFEAFLCVLLKLTDAEGPGKAELVHSGDPGVMVKPLL